MKPISTPVLLLLALTALALASPPCIPLTGIDDGTASSLNSSALALLPAGTVASSIFGTFAITAVPIISILETPVQFHVTNSYAAVVYSTLAAYEPAALSAFGRRAASRGRGRQNDASHAPRLCRPAAAEDDPAFRLHRQASIAYANIFISRVFYNHAPEQLAVLESLVESWGLDLIKCDGDAGCAGGPGTPWAIAWEIVGDMKVRIANDGWNRDGGLSRQYNKRPYEDWRDVPYKPSGAASCGAEGVGLERWAPVREDGGLGFSFDQRHVTPHIGETGKTNYLEDKEFCARELPGPAYDLEEELAAALERTAALDGKKKMEVEIFDNKLTSLFSILGEYFARRGKSVDSFEFWMLDAALNAASYDGTLLVWREKVRTDKARPTTVAEVLGRGKTARAYAGKGEGTKEIPVDEWEPYIRTMPHAEYPSASSCFCTIFAELLTLHSGSDDFTSLIGGPILRDFAAGSSTRYPGVEPSQNVTLTFSSWSEIAKVCGESRLNGGMHFRAAVPAGVQLCRGIAEISVKAVTSLVEGKIPEYVSDMHTPQTKQTRC